MAIAPYSSSMGLDGYIEPLRYESSMYVRHPNVRAYGYIV